MVHDQVLGASDCLMTKPSPPLTHIDNIPEHADHHRMFSGLSSTHQPVRGCSKGSSQELCTTTDLLSALLCQDQNHGKSVRLVSGLIMRFAILQGSSASSTYIAQTQHTFKTVPMRAGHHLQIDEAAAATHFSPALSAAHA